MPFSIHIVVEKVGVRDWIYNFVRIFAAWKINSMYQLSRILILCWIVSELMIKTTCLLQALCQIKKKKLAFKILSSVTVYINTRMFLCSSEPPEEKKQTQNSNTEALFNKIILNNNNNKSGKRGGGGRRNGWRVCVSDDSYE